MTPSRKQKQWTITLNENPTKWEIAKALADRDDLEIQYNHPPIPEMSYPKMRLDRITGHSFFSKLNPIKYLP